MTLFYIRPLFPGSGKNQEAPPVSVHMFNGVFKFNPNTSLGKWVFISQTLLSFTPLLILLVQVCSRRPKSCVNLIRIMHARSAVSSTLTVL